MKRVTLWVLVASLFLGVFGTSAAAQSRFSRTRSVQSPFVGAWLHENEVTQTLTVSPKWRAEGEFYAHYFADEVADCACKGDKCPAVGYGTGVDVAGVLEVELRLYCLGWPPEPLGPMDLAFEYDDLNDTLVQGGDVWERYRRRWGW